MIEGLVFDLDDTLFDERDYVRSGFAQVVRQVARADDEAIRYDDWLSRAFHRGVRGDTFNRFLAAFPELATRTTVEALVHVYREHEPQLALAEGVEQGLDRLRSRVRLGLLTDGPVTSQMAKIKALNLGRWFDPILVTDMFGPDFAKPGQAGFLRIAAAWDLPGERLAFVGDNPEKDFFGPRGLGWTTIRLRRVSQLRCRAEPRDAAFAPDLEVATMASLMAWLEARTP